VETLESNFDVGYATLLLVARRGQGRVSGRMQNGRNSATIASSIQDQRDWHNRPSQPCVLAGSVNY
jgi:hypothetical protein